MLILYCTECVQTRLMQIEQTGNQYHGIDRRTYIITLLCNDIKLCGISQRVLHYAIVSSNMTASVYDYNII